MGLVMAVWLGMGDSAMCLAGIAAPVIPVPRNTHAAKQTLTIVQKPIPALAL